MDAAGDERLGAVDARSRRRPGRACVMMPLQVGSGARLAHRDRGDHLAGAKPGSQRRFCSSLVSAAVGREDVVLQHEAVADRAGADDLLGDHGVVAEVVDAPPPYSSGTSNPSMPCSPAARQTSRRQCRPAPTVRGSAPRADPETCGTTPGSSCSGSNSVRCMRSILATCAGAPADRWSDRRAAGAGVAAGPQPGPARRWIRAVPRRGRHTRGVRGGPRAVDERAVRHVRRVRLVRAAAVPRPAAASPGAAAHVRGGDRRRGGVDHAGDGLLDDRGHRGARDGRGRLRRAHGRLPRLVRGRGDDRGAADVRAAGVDPGALVGAAVAAGRLGARGRASPSRPGCCCVARRRRVRLRVRAAESCRALGALLVAEARSDPIDRLAAEAAAARRAAAGGVRPHAVPARAAPGTPTGPWPCWSTSWTGSPAWRPGWPPRTSSGHPCRGEIDTVVEVAGALLDRCGTGLLTADSGEPIRTGLRALMAARHRAANATLDRIGLADGAVPGDQRAGPVVRGQGARVRRADRRRARAAGAVVVVCESLRRCRCCRRESLPAEQLDGDRRSWDSAIRGAAGSAIVVGSATRWRRAPSGVVLGAPSVCARSAGKPARPYCGRVLGTVLRRGRSSARGAHRLGATGGAVASAAR